MSCFDVLLFHASGSTWEARKRDIKKVVAKIIPTLICWLRPINETEWIGYQCTSQSQPQQLSFFTFKYSSA